MELYNNNISGNIPSEFGNLANLVSLDLYLNNLTGPIPDSLENVFEATVSYKSLFMATPPPEADQGGQDVEAAGVQSVQRDPGDPTSKSLSTIKSLMLKRKTSGVNVSKPQLGKRKSPIAKGPVVRSPLLKRMLLSPRMGPRRSRVMSPSARSPSLDDSRTITARDLAQGSCCPDQCLHTYVIDKSRPPKRRKLTSAVWNDFDAIYDGNLLVQARCKHCLDIFAANRENGRSNCSRHLKSCKELIKMNEMVENMTSSLSPDTAALNKWKFNEKVSRKALARFVVLQELPFSLVDHEPFRTFCATLNPWFEMVSRTTIKEDIVGSYEEQRLALREIIHNSDSRVSLTADFWTSVQNMGYLCITCHFIDNDWKLQKRIIAFRLVASPHDGLTMFNALLKSLQDWHLEHKLFSITLDNATNNDKMIEFLKTNFVQRGLIPCKGDLLHRRCAAHVLNLIVQDGFKTMGSATSSIRESVKYIRSSVPRKERFEEIIVQVGTSAEKRPSLDVPTRWNSTYLMLESSLKHRTAFESLKSQDPSYKDAPTAAEWKMADRLSIFFENFYDATNAISGSQYPTAHLYFHYLWEIKKMLDIETASKDHAIAAMACDMEEKFQKYWDLSLLQICVPVVLDPRLKLKFVAFRLRKGWPNKAEAYVKEVKRVVKDLYSDYSSKMPCSNSDNTQPSQNDQLVDEDSPWADWEQLLTTQRKNKVKSELDTYLQDDPFPREDGFDILQWWKMHSSKYPVLSRVARDVFAAPASTVASESAFSTGDRVINEYRSRLTSKTVEVLICLQDWLRAQGCEGFFSQFKDSSDVNMLEEDSDDGEKLDLCAEV
ncbi:hypothetical protein ACP70R_007607 [Stipagrostis hirtigluma subsp. patula]